MSNVTKMQCVNIAECQNSLNAVRHRLSLSLSGCRIFKFKLTHYVRNTECPDFINAACPRSLRGWGRFRTTLQFPSSRSAKTAECHNFHKSVCQKPLNALSASMQAAKTAECRKVLNPVCQKPAERCNFFKAVRRRLLNALIPQCSMSKLLNARIS